MTHLFSTPARTLAIFIAVTFALSNFAAAQVVNSSPTGFNIKIEHELDVDSNEAFKKFVDDFSKWYDVSHSYSQKAENLSLDLEKHCMFEKLDNGGFVRHMEIVFFQPGKVIRMTGGLGPLQGMGVSGAMTYTFGEKDGKSTITMNYVVSGADFMQLDKIATPVNQVLRGQMDRFRNYCNSGDATVKGKAADKNW